MTKARRYPALQSVLAVLLFFALAGVGCSKSGGGGSTLSIPTLVPLLPESAPRESELPSSQPSGRTPRASPSQAAESVIPEVYFEHGYPFDQTCEPGKKEPITDAMETELDRRLPEFQALWDKNAEALLGTTVKMLGPDFGRHEESATLILCPWFAPMSSPLMLRVRAYLKSATQAESKDYYTTPRPDFYFVSQVYHELLHRYLDRNFSGIFRPDRSSLNKKYSSEKHGVLIHTHLLALQQATYLALHRDDELKKVIELDSRIPGGIYKRAWEIVTQEGYEKFLGELKLAHGPY